MKKMLYLSIVLALLLSACTAPLPPTPAATPTTAPTGVPRFEKADCWFTAPLGQKVDCGYLIVPEDHAKPDGKTIKLAVGRFKSSAAQPQPDPIVYLEGGPGGSPLKAYVAQFPYLFGPLAEKRDVILFDQRGTGYSQPALNCPEIKQLTLDTLNQNLSLDKSRQLNDEAAQQCHDRLVKEGVDLALFNTAQNAADIEMLRQALGLDQINLYGTSYGTRLALTALRDHPQGIRSAVIDSVVPLQVDLFAQTPVNGAQALEKVFATCEADATCSKNYPNLRQVFSDVKARLDKEPAQLEITLNSGEKKPAVMNGDSFVQTLFQGLYATSLIPSFPRLVYDARDGKYDLLGGLIATNLAQLDDISLGMYYSAHCQEEAPYTNVDQLKAAAQQNPDFAVLGDTGTLDVCQNWKVPAAPPLENQAVKSDVPTLVISGEFDPITPPAFGEAAAQTLSKSFYFMIPRAGHGSSVSEDCPRSILLAFVDAPTQKPDSACLTALTQGKFDKPLKAENFKLIPVTEKISTGLNSISLNTVVPDGWQKLSPGAYSPNGKMTDSTAIIVQALPVPPDTLLNLLKTQFESNDLKVTFENAGSREANGIQWDLYTTSISIADVALGLGVKDNVTYLVMVQAPKGDFAVLRDAVFLPAIDATQPAQ